MPRGAINIAKLKGAVGTGFVLSAFTAADVANNHYWLLQDGDILVVLNVGASIGRVVDVHGVVDEMGRELDADMKSSATVTPQGLAIFGPLTGRGWVQSGAGEEGRIWVDVVHADLRLQVLRR